MRCVELILAAADFLLANVPLLECPDRQIETTYNIIPKHFAKICELAAKGDFKSAAKWQDEANRVVELMIESDNWSYRKAMMKFIGLDCGPFRKPFEPLTPREYNAYAKRFAKLGVVKGNQAR